MEERIKGRVVNYFQEKGFGFIRVSKHPEVKSDVFVCYKDIEVEKDGIKTLKSNWIVEFDLTETQKGYHAKNLLIISEDMTDLQGNTNGNR